MHISVKHIHTRNTQVDTKDYRNVYHLSLKNFINNNYGNKLLKVNDKNPSDFELNVNKSTVCGHT